MDVAVHFFDDGGGVDGWGHGDHTLSAVAVSKALGVEGDLGNACIDAGLIATHISSELFDAGFAVSFNSSLSDLVSSP